MGRDILDRPLARLLAGPGCPGPRDLTRALRKAATGFGVDQVGVASPARLSELKAQLAPLMDGENEDECSSSSNLSAQRSRETLRRIRAD